MSHRNPGSFNSSLNDSEDFEALLALRSCIHHMEKRYDRLMHKYMTQHPKAPLPEGKPGRIREIPAGNVAELSGAGDLALDRVYVTGPDLKQPHIMAAVTFDNLPPTLKALFLILSEEGAEPTPDSLRPWKSHEYILEHLPALKSGKKRTDGAVRQLISRLRAEFVRRGLSRNLIETTDHMARLRVRCGEDPTPPTDPTPPPCDTPPSA